MRHSTLAHANADGFGKYAPGCMACNATESGLCNSVCVVADTEGLGRCIRPANHTEVFCKDKFGNSWTNSINR